MPREPDVCWHDLMLDVRRPIARLVPRQWVDDVVQDTIAEFLRSCADGSNPRDRRKLARSIARRCAADTWRRVSARTGPRTASVDHLVDETTTAPRLRTWFRDVLVPRLESRLTRRQRTVLRLTLQGEGRRTIARRLAVDRTTVRECLQAIALEGREAARITPPPAD